MRVKALMPVMGLVLNESVEFCGAWFALIVIFLGRAEI